MTPDSIALDFLEELGMASLPIIPQDICRTLGIFYDESPYDRIDGSLLVLGGKAMISVNSSIRECGRKNFTCAHELGHYCMDVGSVQAFQCTRENVEGFVQTSAIELRANLFAAELLMPRSMIKPLVINREPGWDTVRELDQICDTSLTAMARRFINLTEHACALILSEKGYLRYYHKNEQFGAGIVMDSRKVSFNTVAHNAFVGENTPDDFQRVKADEWLSGPGVNPHTEILEWTLPINSYGQVLTILWDDEGIKGYDPSDEDEDDDDVEWDPPTFHKSRRK